MPFIETPGKGSAVWLHLPGPNGNCEWMVHPDEKAMMLEQGWVRVNGLKAIVNECGPYAIRPDSCVSLVFHDGPAAAREFDPHTTDQLKFVEGRL